jgi:hypothetical protein
MKSYAAAINRIIKNVTGLTVVKTRKGNFNYGDYRGYKYRVFDNSLNRTGSWTPDISNVEASAIATQIKNLGPGLKVTVHEGDIIVTQTA